MQDLKNRAIYVTKHGSHAYGLNTETSDLDIKGVLIAKAVDYLGFLNKIQQIEEKEPNDLVIYELTKFFRLAADCNPNIVEVLWTDESDIIFCNKLGEEVRKLRQQFLSQRAKYTFSGYAISQLKKLKNHYRWIKNPPQTGDATMDYAHYLEWKDARKYRNPARMVLEDKFGYDTKDAMHLVRLLRMGYEILTTGKVNVKRPDREELLAIRNHGIWSYEQVIEYAEGMDKKLTDIYNSKTSSLPYTPDLNLLNGKCSNILKYTIDLETSYSDFNGWDGIVPA